MVEVQDFLQVVVVVQVEVQIKVVEVEVILYQMVLMQILVL